MRAPHARVVAVAVLAACAAAAAGQTMAEGDWVRVPLGATVCNVFGYGAVGDGHTDDTKAVQAAITACAASGGVAYLPSNGTFMSWGLTVPKTSNFGLRVEGTLRFFNDTAKWPTAAQSCLTFDKGSTYLAIFGHGMVDGQGAAWWPCAKAGCFRPGLVYTHGVFQLLVANLTFVNSPNHVLELYATPFEVVGVTITAPSSTAPEPSWNTDGIDVHGNYAYIHDSAISVGDDHVAMHANHTLVERMVFGTGHGASIGSLGDGTYLTNITVRDSSVTGSVQPIRIKADPDSSGFLRDVLYENISVSGCDTTVVLMMNYTGQPLHATDRGAYSTLQISNVTFSDITSQGAGAAGQLWCSPDAPCTDLLLRNVVHSDPVPAAAWSCAFAHGSVQGDVVPPLTCLLP